MKWIESLKNRWGVNNYFDVAVILIVFACTGFSVMYLKRWLLVLIGFDQDTATWLRWTFGIVIVLPLYQVVLLFYGWLFGKFTFFWDFEKRLFRRLFFRNL